MPQQQSPFEEKWPQVFPYEPDRFYEHVDPYGQGEKLRPGPPRRRPHSLRNLIIAIVMVLALMLGAGAMYYSVHVTPPHHVDTIEAKPLPMKTSSYAGTRLDFFGSNSDVHIHTGNTSKVQLITSNDISVGSIVDHGVITMEQMYAGRPGYDLSNIGYIGLVVPKNMPITIGMGKLSVTSVEVEGVISKLNISIANGDINIKDSTLLDGSSLTTNEGSIHFNGSLDLMGKYAFLTVSGDIDARLTDGREVNVSTSTESGKVNNHLSSTKNPNAATLTINTTSGSINVGNQ